MANFGNPMDYFQAGMAGGAARSPVSGIGNAIRGVLAHSDKLGLIDAQAGANLQSSVGTAAYKRSLDMGAFKQAGPQPEGGIYRDKGTGKNLIENYTYDKNTGQWIKKVSPASFNLLESVTAGGGAGGEQGGLEQILKTILENIKPQE